MPEQEIELLASYIYTVLALAFGKYVYCRSFFF